MIVKQNVSKVCTVVRKTREPKIQKQYEYKIIENIRKKENEAIKDKIIGDIKTLFEPEEEYCKRVRVSNFSNNNYIEYKSNGDKNKTLSIKEYLEEIKLYLKDIINNPKKSDSWKIKLAIAINFIYSKDIDKDPVMYSKSHNRNQEIEIMAYDRSDEVIE